MVCQSQCVAERLSAIMFLVYGDESLDETQSRVCAVGGLVGTEKSWSDLEPKWKSLHCGTPFHATDCDSNKGDYQPKPDEDSDAKHKSNKSLYEASIILLAESGVCGFASAYDLAAEREAFPPTYGPAVYYGPFLDVLCEILKFSSNHHMAKLSFDSRIESEHNAGLIYANLRENNPGWKERLAEEISFVSSKTCVRIQIADLFAREAMKVLDNKVSPVKRSTRRSWETLQNTGRFVVLLRGISYFHYQEQHRQQMGGSLGLTPTEFQSWLKAKKRQRNLTASIEFLLERVNQMTPEQEQASENFWRVLR